MFRVIKESENVDERQHCFLIQSFGKQSHYFSVETRQVGWRQTHDHDLINTLDNSICTQELLRLESAWHKSVCLAISHLGSKTFHVVYKNKPSAFTLGKSPLATVFIEVSLCFVKIGRKASVWNVLPVCLQNGPTSSLNWRWDCSALIVIINIPAM